MTDNLLKKIIIERIQREGFITFETFMDMALYYPGLGYYMSEKSVIGPEGDFYTSPHLHPIFGWLLAIQIDEVRRLMGDPEKFTILEIGAGRGYLSGGIISYIQRELNWHNGWRYIIAERNSYMQQKQKELLSEYKEIVQWTTSLANIGRFCGCIVSNEIIDSFPVHIIQMNEAFSEIYVGVDENGFNETAGKLSTPDLAQYIGRYRIPEIKGYRTEVNMRTRDFLKDINGLLAEGFVITIDYGYPSWEYYADERSDGTLLCYHRHTYNEDPYNYIGDQDITAHANFSSLRDWGEEFGMKTIGYCPQGTFLVSLGIDEVISKRLKADPDFQREILKIKGLLFGMGDTHKVMIQYKGKKDIRNLMGFRLRNKFNLL